MQTGYLVTLADSNLDSGDAIGGGAISFTADGSYPTGLGAGQWTWTGEVGGTPYTNELEPGQYWLADDGDVYFVPDCGTVDFVTTASATTAPAYSSSGDGVVMGTSSDDVIDSDYTDNNGEVVDGGDGSGTLGHEDVISAGSGNDSVEAGLEDDTVYGGSGDDTLDGGGGDDLIYGDDGADLLLFGESFGSDTVVGGEGGTDDDTIDLSAQTAAVTVTYTDFEAGTITEGGNTVTFSEIENITTTDFADYVDGTASVSNMSITAGDGEDTILGGAGDDTVYGGDGLDRFYGAGGDNTFYGGSGNDRTYFHNTDGNLVFHAGEDVDGADIDTLDIWHYTASGFTVTFTGDEAGTFASTDSIITGSFTGLEAIQGTVLDDTVDASSSTESISLTTFEGDDSVLGSSSDDSINLREGSDTVEGGAGDDVINLGSDSDRDTLVTTNLSGADVVTNFDLTDFGDGTTIDQIDVSDLINDDGDPVSSWDVVVTDTNGDGTGDAILTFPNGENVTLTGILPSQVDSASELNAMGIPCFTTETQIATPTGEVAVELLRPGDLVTTLEHGPQPVRWLAISEVGDGCSPLQSNVMPVRIKPGALGNQLPLVLSPQHCILVSDEQKGRGVYVRAKHLAEETRLAAYARGRKRVTYVHVLLDQHATLISNGIPSESFYPGPMALEMLSGFDRMRLHSLFPDLARKPVEQVYGQYAAPVLKRRDVRKMAAKKALSCFRSDFITV